MKKNKEMSVWSALFGGLTDKKPPKKTKKINWYQTCSECGEEYEDCECSDCKDDDCKKENN